MADENQKKGKPEGEGGGESRAPKEKKPKAEGGAEAGAGGGKPEKGAKGEGAPRPERSDKGEKSAKGEKGDKGAKGKGDGGKGKDKDKDKKPSKEAKSTSPIPVRLKEKYKKEVIAALTKEFNFQNPMQVPKLVKITLNFGLGEAVANAKVIDSALEDLKAIAGQKPVRTLARKSIATYKLREGMPIGVMVTLRRDRMYEFLDRLISLGLPRVRDFKGVSPKAFDGRGNYSLGIKEQIIFPEINYDKLDKIRGMNVSITTSARTDEQGLALLRFLGMPFRKPDEPELEHTERRPRGEAEEIDPKTGEAKVPAPKTGEAKATPTGV